MRKTPCRWRNHRSDMWEYLTHRIVMRSTLTSFRIITSSTWGNTGTNLWPIFYHQTMARVQVSFMAPYRITRRYNHGLTFTLYLPSVATATTVKRDEISWSIEPKEDETILIIDDEEMIRMIASELPELGYQSIGLMAEQGLNILKEHMMRWLRSTRLHDARSRVRRCSPSSARFTLILM